MWRIVAVVLCVTLVHADPVNFKDCGSVSGKINSLDINPCPSEPCQLKKGTTVMANVNFTSFVNSNIGKTVVHGIINNVPVPYPLPEGKFSPDLPMKQNTTVVYTDGIPVLKSYPKISLLVKWEIQDDTGKDLFCFVIPAQIVD